MLRRSGAHAAARTSKGPPVRKLSLLAPALLLLVPEGGAMASGGGGGGTEALYLVPMDEIRVPIIDGSRTDGALRLKLVLEAADGAAADKATASLPVLRSAAVATALEFARLYASPFMPVDASRLTEQMTVALHAQDARISRVLLVEVAATRS